MSPVHCILLLACVTAMLAAPDAFSMTAFTPTNVEQEKSRKDSESDVIGSQFNLEPKPDLFEGDQMQTEVGEGFGAPDKKPKEQLPVPKAADKTTEGIHQDMTTEAQVGDGHHALKDVNRDIKDMNLIPLDPDQGQGVPLYVVTDALEGSGDEADERHDVNHVETKPTPDARENVTPTHGSETNLASGCSEQLCDEIRNVRIAAHPTTVEAAEGSEVEFICAQDSRSNVSHWFKLRWTGATPGSKLSEKQTGGTGRARSLYGRVTLADSANYTCLPDVPTSCCNPEEVGASVALHVYVAQPYTAHLVVVTALTLVGLAFCVALHYYRRRSYSPVPKSEPSDGNWEHGAVQ